MIYFLNSFWVFFNPNKAILNYMMLTNVLLFLILVTLLSYYLIPWENFTKSPFKVLIKFWFKVFFSLIIILGVIGFISHNFFI